MILAIDTAGPALGLALFETGRVIASITVDRPHCHDEFLAPALLQLLEYGAVTMDDIRAVAVTSGPGSYTGLRIGMAAAKGVALSRDIPLLAVPTFPAMAARVLSRVGQYRCTLVTLLDARQEDVYYSVFAIDGTEISELTGPTVATAAEVAGLLPEGCLLTGDGADKVAAASGRVFGVLADAVSRSLVDAVAALGAEMLARDETADLARCEPLYLRAFVPKSAKPLF